MGRLPVRRFGLPLLLAGTLVVGPALPIYFLFFQSGPARNSPVHSPVDGDRQAAPDGSASVVMDRVGRLEAQLKQAPNRDELTSTRQQADELRRQLTQATEQLTASQDRVSQLEAQLKQAPNRDELTSDELLAQATEQVKASHERL